MLSYSMQLIVIYKLQRRVRILLLHLSVYVHTFIFYGACHSSAPTNKQRIFLCMELEASLLHLPPLPPYSLTLSPTVASLFPYPISHRCLSIPLPYLPPLPLYSLALSPTVASLFPFPISHRCHSIPVPYLQPLPLYSLTLSPTVASQFPYPIFHRCHTIPLHIILPCKTKFPKLSDPLVFHGQNVVYSYSWVFVTSQSNICFRNN
jgi:hypothetical protein